MQPLRLVVCGVQVREAPRTRERPHPQRRRVAPSGAASAAPATAAPPRGGRAPPRRARAPSPAAARFPARPRSSAQRKRRAQVALLPLEARQPGLLLRPVQRRCGPFRQRECRTAPGVRAVASASPRAVRCSSAYCRTGSSKRYHACLARAVNDDQRLVHQPRQDLEDRQRRQVGIGTDRLHRLERERRPANTASRRNSARSGAVSRA